LEETPLSTIALKPNLEMTTVTSLATPAPLSPAGAGQATVRYGMCWEDADVLLRALAVQPGDVCLSICSGGENTLSLLAKNPARVIAIDTNIAQLATLELKIAAYRALTWEQSVEFLTTTKHRRDYYLCCRPFLSPSARLFWDENADALLKGFSCGGKFERYFNLFRNWVLPLVHRKATVNELLAPGKTFEQRNEFYEKKWNSLAWKIIFRVFFSRKVMGSIGRDKACFNHVEGQVAERILGRTKFALTNLNPASNPYLHFILRGSFGDNLPFALRKENYEAIKENLDKVEICHASLGDWLKMQPAGSVDSFNLSDVFEYMSVGQCHDIYSEIVRTSTNGARVAYWNMLVDRHAPSQLPQLISEQAVAEQLLRQDKAFFYSKFVLERVAK
jgi:S-adenosylmethionine-diacylglycerol 3-amino-3-carboxypropyl transferase